MQILKRAAVLGVLASGLASDAATAQLVTVGTEGGFSGPGCSGLVCTFGGYTLRFEGNALGVIGIPANAGDFVPLGSFFLQCGSGGPNLDTPGCPSGVPVTIPSGVTFTLIISQFSSQLLLNGQIAVPGTFSGSVEWNPFISALVWSVQPSASLLIGPVLYKIPAVQLNPPMPGLSTNPRETQFAGQIVLTPEPSTIALVAIGLLGLLPLARRPRRRDRHGNRRRLVS